MKNLKSILMAVFATILTTQVGNLQTNNTNKNEKSIMKTEAVKIVDSLFTLFEKG